MKYHFNARWYDADTARFVSEDPARDGVSWFAYVGNNPLSFVDPTGLWYTENEVMITSGVDDVGEVTFPLDHEVGIPTSFPAAVSPNSYIRRQAWADDYLLDFSQNNQDLLDSATQYLLTEAEAIKNQLLDEADLSGRTTIEIFWDASINGIYGKVSFQGVIEASSENPIRPIVSGVIGIDFGLATPGLTLTRSGAYGTIGVRAKIGQFQNLDSAEEQPIFGLRSISFALNAGADFLGQGGKIEYRREIINFDTPSGEPDFSFFSDNNNTFGIKRGNTTGNINISTGVRANDL
jgi:hypothetical protein